MKDQLEQVDFPLEYHAELLGDFTQQQDAQRRTMGFALAAALGIFLLLQAAFGSWRVAIVTFLTLPVALAGGALAAWLHGGPLTLATVGGLLAVLALTLRNSMALLNSYRRLRTEDAMPLGLDLVMRGTRERVGPIVITMGVTAVALLPAVLLGGIAGQEIIQPMAIVIMGGLVTSALVSLFVLPALYLRFGPRQEPEPLDFRSELHDAEAQLATAGVGES